MQFDDDSISAPADVSVFGCYSQFGTRYSVDVPVLLNPYGLNETGSGRNLPPSIGDLRGRLDTKQSLIFGLNGLLVKPRSCA